MRQFKYDTHVHTSEVSECAKVPSGEMVRMYRDAGYHGVVITDHYTGYFFNKSMSKSWEFKIRQYLTGYYNALNEGIKLGLQVIPGMEITFEENSNDYLIYGFDEYFLKKHKELHKLGLKNFKKCIEGRGFMVVQAHPFRLFMTQTPPELLDGVEVYNGNPRHDSRNLLALEYAKKNDLIKLSGSDFHQQQDLARGGILVSKEIRNPLEFVDAIRNGGITGLIRSR
jgi:hypothetical protein